MSSLQRVHLLRAINRIIVEAPTPARNALARALEDYCTTFYRPDRARRNAGGLLDMILDTIEEASEARIERNDK